MNKSVTLISNQWSHGGEWTSFHISQMFYYIIIQYLPALVEGGKESKSLLPAFELLII